MEYEQSFKQSGHTRIGLIHFERTCSYFIFYDSEIPYFSENKGETSVVEKFFSSYLFIFTHLQ